MKILIIDDHALFREGLKYVLSELDDNVTVLESAEFSCAIQKIIDNPGLDLVLLDLNLPGKDGFSTLNELTIRYPVLPVVIISASNLRSDIQRTLDAGAMGYIPKESTSNAMLNALRVVLEGGIYLPPNMAQPFDQAQALAPDYSLSSFTSRQRQVLTLLIKGESNKQIAAELNLAEATVKMHVSAIFKILNVTNRTQAALAVDKAGLNSFLTNN